MEQANVEAAQTLIDKINEKLKLKCPKLNLVIVKYGYKTVKLCLNKDNNCISNLVINNDNARYNILSNTEKKYEGKKYNKLLTAVSIVIANALDESLTVLYSNTQVDARKHILEKYIHKKTEVPSTSYHYDIIEVPSTSYELNIKDNQVIANKIIDDVISELDCGDDVMPFSPPFNSGGNKTKRNKHKRKKSKSTLKQNKSKRYYNNLK